MFNFRLGNTHYWNVTLDELHELFKKEAEKRYANAIK
ncbi:hypothetical protein MUDAN_DOGOELCO_03311 [Lactiplantibacillus mudanjiangensis]|nr:hypothetical protein MUDAN_DOGOELCO_03311 [Lactiplantibacillus mudanjiangensis]